MNKISSPFIPTSNFLLKRSKKAPLLQLSTEKTTEDRCLYKARAIQNVIEEDFLVFEGIRRPLEVAFVRDGGSVSYAHKIRNDQKTNNDIPKEIKDSSTENRNEILAQYLTDVYTLFLHKLTTLVTANKISREESKKLQSLLDEMIKVKGLIERE